MRRMMSLAVLTVCCVAGAQAQMGGMPMPAAPAVGTALDPAKEIDGMLSLFEKELTGAVKAMPADKYSFAPTGTLIAGSKYDGVRTFAAQVQHLIQANYSFYSRVGGMKPDVDMKAIGAMTSKDELVAALTASFGVAHGYDHYGQIVEYLRMNGIVPPASS